MNHRWCVWLLVLATISVGEDREFCSEAAPTPESFIRPGETLDIQIVGRDCRWEVTYPGRDGVLATADDILAGNRLRLPEETTIRLHLHSADFVYSFALPDLDLREIAVPDMVFTLSMTALAPRQLTLRGGEMCGDRRNELSGTVIVESPAEWNAWLHQFRSGHE
jgi:cytochrome c oxidase subunit II